MSRFLQNGIHAISSMGKDQKVRKLYHNELSENYVMEGKTGEKAFKDMILAFAFPFCWENLCVPVECVHSLLGCPLKLVTPLGPTCLLLSDSIPSCSSATSIILLLFFISHLFSVLLYLFFPDSTLRPGCTHHASAL